MSESVLNRFLKYVRYDTQSVRESDTEPSSAKELVLAEELVRELKDLGITDARIGKGGVVYATIPATKGCEECPAVGFIAHMDTSPDASGTGVKPQILRFTGDDVLLNAEKNIVFPVKNFPEIAKYKGEDIVFTDGTTLLGADDKAGVAAVMAMAEYITNHPEIPHAKLCIGFTPDEEIAKGTVNFDIAEFGAAYAYTFDGGEAGTLETENFNAATAVVTVEGVGVHPGLAKNKMVNSLRYAAKFMEMLPADVSPECTEVREGFIHPNMMQGNVVKTVIRILVRDHDKALFEEKKELLKTLVAKMNSLCPQAPTTITIKDSYQNMKPYLDKAPKVVELVRLAYEKAGLTPIEEPIRGGTDGARLSSLGLPCPNVFTHGMKAIKDTLIIACIGTPLGGLLAVLIGYAATRLKVRGHKTLETVSLLNYTLPGTVVGIAYIIAFNDKPLVLTGTVWILVAAYLFRYSSAGIRNVIAALTQIDPSIEEASRSLGASSFKTFTSITIPMVLPAVLAGMRYLFIHSMTAISATIFLVSVHWTLITTRILECMTELQFAQACAFSVVLILLVFTASGLMALIARTLCRTGDNIGAR